MRYNTARFAEGGMALLFRKRTLVALLTMACALCGLFPLPASAQLGGEMARWELILAGAVGKLAKAEKATVAIEGRVEPLRAGHVGTMRAFLTGVRLDGVRYDKMVVVLRNVDFRISGKEAEIDAIGSSEVSGSLTKADFLAALKEHFGELRDPEVVIRNGKITIKGVYAKEYVMRLKALVRFTGKYVIDPESGEAYLAFDEATTDNPFVSTADIGKALSKKAPRLSLASFFVKPNVADVRVDKQMVWFSTKP